MKNAALVLLSGGLDSVYAFLAARRESDVLCALTYDYGQRARVREIAAAESLCRHYGVPHQKIVLPFFSELTKHPLLDGGTECPTLPNNRLDDIELATKTAKTVWVPNRNGIFLSVAASLVEARGAKRLYVGFNAEEAATFPDNSAAFVAAMNASLAYSTQNQVEIHAPPIALRKTDIVRELVQADFDFSFLWSCYLGGDKMCGRCESCLRLKRALGENGVAGNFLC